MATYQGQDVVVKGGTKRECGIVIGTPKPGVVMQPVRGTALSNGMQSWEPYGTTAASGSEGVAADGNQRILAILNIVPGKTRDDAFVSGELGELIFPEVGDEFNLWVLDAVGTGDDVTPGDLLTVDDGTGKLTKTTGSPESEPFEALQTATDPAADYVLHCKYTGY